MTDEEIQQLIEHNFSNNRKSELSSKTKEQDLYESIFEELNNKENIPVPFLFSENVIKEIYIQKERKKEAKTRLKSIALTLIALFLSGISIYVFKINLPFSVNSPYFLLGILIVTIYVLSEIADYYLIQKEYK